MSKARQSIHIGTSGWSYTHWKGPFYPPDIKEKAMLDYYCRYFRSVEINNSFYHLPHKMTLEQWRDSTPQGFVFAVKASRYITHMKKLNQSGSSLDTLLGRVEILGDKLGPVLFQLPPHWRYNYDRLAQFLASLSDDYRYAFEFRDQSWLNPQCYELLARHQAALCIYDLDGYESPRELTADFVYVRLHGPNGAYQGDYDTRSLTDWAAAFSAWAAQGRSIYCYFDNDEAGYAVQNASALQAMLEKR